MNGRRSVARRTFLLGLVLLLGLIAVPVGSSTSCAPRGWRP